MRANEFVTEALSDFIQSVKGAVSGNRAQAQQKARTSSGVDQVLAKMDPADADYIRGIQQGITRGSNPTPDQINKYKQIVDKYRTTQNSPATPGSTAPEPATPSTPQGMLDKKLTDIGLKVINDEPIILRYKKQDFHLNDQGRWSNLNSNKPLNQTMQAFLDHVHDLIIKVQGGTVAEGGNVFPDVVDIKKEYVKEVVAGLKKLLPNFDLQADIGSAGYKVASGDMDIFLDQDQVVQAFKSKDEKEAKQALAKFVQAKGYQTAVKGRNVHVRWPLPDGTFAQIDLMVIPDSKGVAPWHQHGPRGSYDDPEFKGSANFILMNSIGKALGYKFDAFSGKLLSREDNSVVAGPNRDEVAKALLNPQASGNDLNSVKSILQALENDPQKDAKLAQARDDAAKGVLKLS
jgi:hypothetical protein